MAVNNSGRAAVGRVFADKLQDMHIITGVSPVTIRAKAYITTPEPLPSYVLYDPNMFLMPNVKDYASKTAEAFKAIYQLASTLVDTTDWTEQEFIAFWNGMEDKVGAVAIYCHAAPDRMLFCNKAKTGITTKAVGKIKTSEAKDEFIGLSKKDVDMVLLYGCNAGMVDVKKNVAERMLEIIEPSGRVVACDGIKAYYLWGGSEVVNDPVFGVDFKTVLKEWTGDKSREPRGWVCYYFKETDTGTEMRISGLLGTDEYKQIYYETLRLYKYSAWYSTNERREVTEPLIGIYH